MTWPGRFVPPIESRADDRGLPALYDVAVSSRRRTYDQWKSDSRIDAAWVARVNASLPPYERRRPRDAHEAKLLRDRGTPEHLIGPTEGTSTQL